MVRPCAEMENELPPKVPRGIAQRQYRDLDHLTSTEYQKEARRRRYQEDLVERARQNWEFGTNRHQFTACEFFDVECRAVQQKKGVEFSKPYWLVKIDNFPILVVEDIETHAALEEWVALHIAEIGSQPKPKEIVVKVDQVEMFPIS